MHIKPLLIWGISMQRVVFICYWWLIMVFIAPAVCFADADEDALALFQQAQEAFESGDLVGAKELSLRAISLYPNDGIVITNKRYRFKQVKYGRKVELIKELTGDRHTYTPRLLLNQIETIYKKNRLSQALEAKHRLPPQLNITYVLLDDEDNDGRLSALEKGRILLAISNHGQHIAQDVNLNVDDTQFDNLLSSSNTSLGDIGVGQTRQTIVYLQPGREIKQHQSTMYVSLKEKDRLGEVHNYPILIETRPYFAPILHLEHLPIKSDGIVHGLSSTQFFKITNKGLEAAYDIALSPAFEKYHALRLINMPDLSNAPYLKVGESLEFQVTLAATQDAIEGKTLGLAFELSARGLAPNVVRADLMMGNSAIYSQRQRSASLQALRAPIQIDSAERSKNIVFDIANFKHVSTQKRAESSAAIILNLSDAKAKQGQNAAFIKTSFLQAVGINKQNLLITNDWDIDAIKQHIGDKAFDELLVYINTQGQYQLHTQTANVQAPKQWYELNTVLHELSNLTTGNIVVFIEAGFNSQHESFTDAQAPLHSKIYAQQALITSQSLPPNLHIIAATQATQLSHSITQHQVGAFTFAVAEYFNQNAGQNSYQSGAFEQAQNIQTLFDNIQARTNELSEYLEGVSQMPWYCVEC